MAEIAYHTAPDADFFCTTYAVYDRTSAGELEWLIAQNVDVINISCEVLVSSRADDNNSYGEAAKLLDRLAQQYDITIINAAGNSGENTVASGAMAYNVITVGNFCIQWGSVMDSTSSYNNESNTTKAYKPDICAPAYVRFHDNHCEAGSSFAAPLVTGVVALLMACRSSLRTNPTQVKAILTASVSLAGPHDMPINQSNYRKHGAGVIDASRANQLIMPGDFFSANTQPTPRYYCEYQVELFANQITRFSLAFEKVWAANGVLCNLSDLNICVYDTYGRLVCLSQTLNNNVELVEFLPTQYGMYTVRIEQLTIANSSGISYATPYTFAWIQG